MTQEEMRNHVVKIVTEMRRNTMDGRMWKNLPLAKKAFQFVKQLDDTEETPEGKALACNAIYHELSEYDSPRQVLEILYYAKQQLERTDDIEDKNLKNDIEEKISCLEDYIDFENISVDDFRKKYSRMLNFSAMERTPLWEEIYYDVQEECDQQLDDFPRGMGFCHCYWHTLQEILAKRGIMWQSPAQLNPGVMFD